jgi:signal peptidase I
MRTPLSRLPHGWRIALDWTATIIFAAVVVLAFEAEVAKPYRIPSASMEPTLHCARPVPGCRAGFSDRVLAARFLYRIRDPQRGDIVVFKTPPAATASCQAGGTFVKRIVGLPGEVVSEREGRVLVDGRPLDETYIDPNERDSRTQTWARVPEHSYFVMGDNRADSCDSRSWGPVPRHDLIGPVVFTYWPLNRLSLR